MHISRRDAVFQLASMIGAVSIAPRLAAASFDLTQTGTFTDDELALLAEVGDTILPPSDVPGAKAIGIGPFIAMMITDCYAPAEQQALRDGLRSLAERFSARFGREFVSASSEQRTEFLNELDREQRQHQATLAPGGLPHYFRVLKELTILGYFSSEVGATQALRYAEVPGGFDGNAPYQRGDRAWFN